MFRFRRAWTLLFLFSLAACNANKAFNPSPIQEGSAECRNLAPGQMQSVDHSLSTLPARYYLTRNADVNGHASYQAVIPVTFYATGACRSTPCAEQRSPYGDRLLGLANSCLAQASPYLRGPGGEALSVQLAPPASGGMGPFQIELTPGLARGDSQHWDTNWGCPEITHEVMHLLGLVDENHEMSLVEGNSYDCRADGPRDSLMSDPTLAFNLASPVQQQVECNCDGITDPECPTAIAALNASRDVPAQCPPPTHEQVFQSAPEWVNARMAATDPWTNAGAPADRFRFTRNGQPRRPSLLYPAEFQAVIAPGCTDRNQLYYTCAANAYRSSYEGEGCVRNLPAACANGGWITGN